MTNRMHAVARLGWLLAVSSTALFAGATTVVTPEPGLVALTAVGVGAVILVARRKRGR